MVVDPGFSDGTWLRNLGAVDRNGNLAHPVSQCGHLTMDTWHRVTVNLSAAVNGKTMDHLDLGVDDPSSARSTGTYAGYANDPSIG